LLDLILGVVLDDQLERAQHGHRARSALVEVLAHGSARAAATSMTFSRFATPTRWQKSRIDSGV
jgi:hypothetical protein